MIESAGLRLPFRWPVTQAFIVVSRDRLFTKLAHFHGSLHVDAGNALRDRLTELRGIVSQCPGGILRLTICPGATLSCICGLILLSAGIHKGSGRTVAPEPIETLHLYPVFQETRKLLGFASYTALVKVGLLHIAKLGDLLEPRGVED